MHQSPSKSAHAQGGVKPSGGCPGGPHIPRPAIQRAHSRAAKPTTHIPNLNEFLFVLKCSIVPFASRLAVRGMASQQLPPPLAAEPHVFTPQLSTAWHASNDYSCELPYNRQYDYFCVFVGEQSSAAVRCIAACPEVEMHSMAQTLLKNGFSAVSRAVQHTLLTALNKFAFILRFLLQSCLMTLCCRVSAASQWFSSAQLALQATDNNMACPTACCNYKKSCLMKYGQGSTKTIFSWRRKSCTAFKGGRTLKKRTLDKRNGFGNA